MHQTNVNCTYLGREYLSPLTSTTKKEHSKEKIILDLVLDQC